MHETVHIVNEHSHVVFLQRCLRSWPRTNQLSHSQIPDLRDNAMQWAFVVGASNDLGVICHSMIEELVHDHRLLET